MIDGSRRRCRPFTARALALGIMLLGGLPTLRAIGQEQLVNVGQPVEVSRILFTGNESFGSGTLKDVIESKETAGWFSQFLYRTLGEKLGSKPEYFDPLRFDTDQKKLRDFYQGEGFYATAITANVHRDSAARRIDLLFGITEGRRSYIDSVIYRGLDQLGPEVKDRIQSDPVCQRGSPYENTKDAVEINRILDILANHGYPMARFDHEHSGAYQFQSTGNFVLTFAFIPGKQYQFDGVSVRVDPPRPDITDDLIVRQLDFQPGELYSQEKKASSERSLNRLGLFESAIIDRAPQWDSANSNTIPMEVTVRPRVRNELAPEIIASNDNNAFNLGLGLGYTNRNFLGDARILTAQSSGRTQSLGDIVLHGRSFRDPAVVGTVDFGFEIQQPYLWTRSLSGTWTSTISAEKQSGYILSILNNKIGLSDQFAAHTFGFFDWTLERVNPEILEDTLQLGPILNVLRQEDQPQFNSIFTVTLQRDKTNDIFSPTEGFFNSVSLEESGILPKLIPGIRSGLPFTQYYKVTLLGRWYRDLSDSRSTILATKLMTGYQNKYGESQNLPVEIPLNRRFFAGGSGSVRGWRARELGAMADALIQFGGNFISEGSAEMRVNHFRGAGNFGPIRMDNIWAVYFIDAGNVWGDIGDFKPNEVAVAAGVGLRYDTFFGPLRIDYGIRAYDPKEVPGKMTVFQRRLWTETLPNGVVQFGIGQAF